MRTLITVALLLLSACSWLNCDVNSVALSNSGTVAEEQPHPAVASPAPPLPTFSTQKSVICISGSDIRTVQIETKKGGGCRLHYTMTDGSEQVLAQSENNPEYCQQALQQFTHNLIRARFDCH